MTVSSNFGNRPQHTAALDVSATGKHVVFAPGVKVRVHGVRVVFPSAIGANASNNIEVQLRTLKGTSEADVGDAFDTDTGNAKTAGQVINVVDEPNMFDLEAGESLVAEVTATGSGAGRFSYGIDYEVIGS